MQDDRMAQYAAVPPGKTPPQAVESKTVWDLVLYLGQVFFSPFSLIFLRVF